MKKALIILLAALAVLMVFVACDQDQIVDDMFGFTVTYDANGGSGEMAPQKMIGTTGVLNENAFKRTGYDFAKWNTEADGSGTPYDDKATVNSTKDIRLYAQWKAQTYAVTFDANGGSAADPKTVTYDSTYGTLPVTTWEGHDFLGWFTAKTGGTKVEETTKVTATSDHTLYAQWDMATYSITYVLNGGTINAGQVDSYTYGTGATLPTDVTRDDYGFVGFYDNSEFSGEVVTSISATEVGDRTFYAKWFQPVVTFDANGGSGTMAAQTVSYDKATALSANTFGRDDYNYTGWNTKADGSGTTYGDGAEIKITADTTLYAQWYQPVVTFHINDGSETPETYTQAVPYDEETALDENEFEWDGYLFLEWNTSADGTGEEYADEQTVTLTEDLDLYAVWAVDLFTTELYKTVWNSENCSLYSLSADTLIDGRITVTGDVMLILADGKTLTASKGISVTEGNLLGIIGNGTLIATAEDYSAGIGGDIYTAVYGTIVIAGGTVNATGGQNAAGIGSGSGEEAIDGGTVIIGGGTVTATGGSEGAGIGGGYKGNGGTITISGENTKVTATGGSSAAGIGGGSEGADGGEITISGGTVIAAGGSGVLYGGAGIGGGGLGDGGTIIISDGNVTATAGDCTYGGAGIGSGSCGEGGIIEISGGEVTATGGKKAAGIGGGSFGIADISISGGIVTATGGSEAAGIGVGPNIGDQVSISITGGTVTATSGGAKASGIGGGNSSDHVSIAIGEGLGLYGGADKDNVAFLSAPTESYTSSRPVYMETKATTYVTVTFDANNAEAEGTMDPQSVPSGIAVPLNANSFTHESLNFAGWATSSEGDVVYADEAPVNLTEATTLYAKWVDGPKVIKSTEEAITLTSGDWTITDTTVTVGGRITIDGTVNLLLPDGKTLNANSGITVSNGNTLVIDKLDSESTGTGILNATATQYGYAGIGGGYTDGYRTAGTITVKYGTVTATGGSNGAGIGGGYNGAGGNITISGGTVIAAGGSYAAGIGGGFNGDGGTLSVSDGTVVANGVNNGAGIGGGANADGGKVTIEGGTVSATGNVGGAGIGGGGNYNNVGGVGADVTISGGSVTATGGSGAVGIGGGNGSSDHGDLTIDDGVIMMVSANNTYWSVYDGSTRKQYMKVPEPIVLTSSTTAWTSGNVYTLGDENVKIESRITVNGTVFLLLPDGKTLNAQEGITVASGNTLVIDKYGSTATGTGTLIATGGVGAAGIGGGNNQAGGTITINGGTVTATGGMYGAGIGGGNQGVGGVLTIAGGTVTATGGENAAGIGGGYNAAGGTVTINGGTVTATGDEGAVGIGAGKYSSDHKTLKIADGVLMMVSTDNKDWSEYDGSTRKQYMKVPEPIVLTSSTTAWTSGNVYTLGDEDVIIESRITVSGSVGLILPDGRKLTASKGITVTGSNSLTINGGTGQNAGILEATGGDRAAGIGGGYQEVGGKVTINGGTVTANGGEGAAGIGGGWYGTTGGTVTINGGTVEAIGGSISGSSGGAGIGGGYYGAGGTVTINNGTVTATGVSGGAGIGGGYYKGGGTVTITGGSVTANGGQNAYGIGRGYGGGSDGTLTLTGVTMQVKDSEEASWESYVEDVRHRYMKADEGI